MEPNKPVTKVIICNLYDMEASINAFWTKLHGDGTKQYQVFFQTHSVHTTGTTDRATVSITYIEFPAGIQTQTNP